MFRFATIDATIKNKMFSKEWGKQVLQQLKLDPSDTDLMNKLFLATWDATVTALDTVLTQLKVDTTKAGQSGMAWTYQAAGLTYFYTHQALMDIFKIKSTLSDKVNPALKKLLEASAKFTKDPKKLATSGDAVKAALKQAADTAAAKNVKAIATSSSDEQPMQLAAGYRTRTPKLDLRVATFNRRIDAVLEKHSAKPASRKRRVALQEKAKQDPSKTMMGGMSEADLAEVQKAATAFKATVEQLDATVNPLTTYAKKFDPSSLKQIGHVVNFVHTTKPVMDRITELVGKLNTGLKSFS